ncbi:MAG: hypothetical protein HRU76_13800 [Phycisphaeraceae bacterium]|nr:hypothetical protein [Phycisphaerales bacterium]QOJ18592.1 MAG: hypothetical protein HRU76_13800 [Phycisphaeraceae bacterium]
MERLTYRSVEGSKGDPYPAWLRELRGESGVYIIRDRASREVLYVGESHTGRLYATITRHFQAWDNSQNTAGPTYWRDDVEVAVRVLCGGACESEPEQDRLIALLDPRDNRLVPADDEPAPF